MLVGRELGSVLLVIYCRGGGVCVSAIVEHQDLTSCRTADMELLFVSTIAKNYCVLSVCMLFQV